MRNLQNHAVEQQLQNANVDVVSYPSLKERFQKCLCGWGVLVTAGAIALTFILCISLVPSTNIFPALKDPYADMVQLIQQGNVRVYPSFLDRRAVALKNDTYFIALPPSDLTDTIESLSNVIESYPRKNPTYRNCWLQNPTYGHPCFFDTEWLGRECTESNDFGYTEVNGTFSPCIILRIEDTGKWAPVPDIHACENFMTGSDPGFIRVDCELKSSEDARKLKSIQVIPSKGFPRLYFPITGFDPKLYLSPAVAVQVNELVKGENVTISCQIAAQNAFYLEDGGLVTINFGY